MSAPKQISNVLATLLENPMVINILDQNSNITPAAMIAESWWDYDLQSRKPNPAYDEDGVFKGTDLDLACFLYALAGRKAVINLPVYKAFTKSKVRTDQVLTSKENRHGELIGVGANKNFWSFNIKIIDQNVIGQDKVGDPRTYMITNYKGEWYEGWQELQFVPTLKENSFITENKLWSGERIYFKNFIHPNRWTSFFGQYYIISKLMIGRLEQEAAHLNQEMKRMKEAGIKFPPGDGPASYDYHYPDKGKQETFDAFEVEVYIPTSQFKNNFKVLENSQENLISAYRKRRQLNKSLERLRFMTRATEYAHFQAPNNLPGWMKNVKWEPDFKIPGGRIKWDRMKLFQANVGEYSVSIIKRQYQKSTTVSENS